MSSRRQFAAGLGGLALVAPGIARADLPPARVRVIFFGVASNLPVWCGVAKGFFAHENLEVTTEITPSSVYMFQHLSSGDFDIAVTAMDNVVAYDEGQGATALANPADFVAFMGGDTGLLSLYTRPELRTYADLKGQPLAVDAITTGYAFVLQKMVAMAGLGPGDYQLVAAGGTPKRYEALISGTCAATLLTAPFDVEAEAKGCHNIGRALDVLGHYQAYTGIARRAWIAQNGQLLVRYIRGYLAALRWLYDPHNKDATIALISSEAKVPAEFAPQVYAETINRQSGIVPNGAIDIPGVRTILALRSQYGVPKKTLANPMKYIDERYYREATKRR